MSRKGPLLSADNERETRGENRERTEKEIHQLKYLFPDYQPLNFTNLTPKKKGKLNESDALKGFDKLHYHKLFIRTPKKREWKT
jgi:hypothetical protein